MSEDDNNDGFDALPLDAQTKIIMYYIDKALKKDDCDSKTRIKNDKDDYRNL